MDYRCSCGAPCCREGRTCRACYLLACEQIAGPQCTRCGAPCTKTSSTCRVCFLAHCATLPLSGQQEQVYAAMLRGLTQKEIACELNISAKTVYTYKTELMKRLGAANEVELVLVGIRQGRVPGFAAAA